MNDLIQTLYFAYIHSSPKREENNSLYKELSDIEDKEYQKLLSLLNEEQKAQLDRFQISSANSDDLDNLRAFRFAMRVGAQLCKLLLEKPVAFDPA